MKKIICIIAAVFTVAPLCGCASGKDEYPNPTEKFFVNDFANVIDSTDEEEFYSKAVALNNATGAQTVIVTVEDLNGEEPADYALNLGRQWGVGQQNSDNGIVILFSRDDREIYIAVGYGLEGALPDSKTGRIIDLYGLEYLKNDNFSKGLLSIGNAIVNEVYIEYGLEPESNYTSIENISEYDYEGGYGKKVVVSWIAMIAVLIIISRLSRGSFLPFFFLGNSRTGGFRGGGRSGGSFGGFSGGGGSFGGGGAGRRF